MTCMLMAVDFGIKWNAFLQTGEFDFFSPEASDTVREEL